MFNFEKKSFKEFLLLAMVLPTLASTSALAGEGGFGAGNGGTGVVCKDLFTGHETVELLDLWEHSDPRMPGPRLAIQVSDSSVDAQIEMAVRRFFQDELELYGKKEALDAALRDELAHVKARLNDPRSYLPQGMEIEFPHEVLPVMRPKGCRYVPIISYQTDGALVIDSESLNKLRASPTAMAALILHEALYRLARDLFGVNDSVLVRKLVARLFAEGGSAQEISSLRKSYLHGQEVVGAPRLRLNHGKPEMPENVFEFSMLLRTDEALFNQCTIAVKVLNSFGHVIYTPAIEPADTSSGEAMDLFGHGEAMTIDFSKVRRVATCKDGVDGTRRCRKAHIRTLLRFESGLSRNEFKTGNYRLWARFRCDSPAEAVIRAPHSVRDNESVVIRSQVQPVMVEIK